MLFKRPGSPHWQIKFSLAGRTVRRSTNTTDKRLAEKIEQQYRQAVLKQSLLGEMPALEWTKARDLWIEEKAQSKRSIQTDKNLFNLIDVYFADYTVDKIDAEAIRAYGALVAARASPATANRHLQLIRAVFRHLAKRKKIPVAPEVELYTIEETEPVWATPDQVEALLAALPGHAKAITEFAVNTGLRKANVLGLEWKWVNLDLRIAFIPASAAKGKKTIPVPLSEKAMHILTGQLGKHDRYVFTDDHGNAPVLDIKTCWDTARKKVGMDNFRFHDLRHTFASWHAMNNTPMPVLQQLGGWADARMVQRYSHMSIEHLAKYANNSSK